MSTANDRNLLIQAMKADLRRTVDNEVEVAIKQLKSSLGAWLDRTNANLALLERLEKQATKSMTIEQVTQELMDEEGMTEQDAKEEAIIRKYGLSESLIDDVRDKLITPHQA